MSPPRGEAAAGAALRLREHAAGVVRRLLATHPAVLALDFDGTLAEIVDDPYAPRLTLERRAVVERVVAVPGVRVAILSGRSLRDVAERVGVPGLTVVGNHGLEMDGWTPPGVERSRAALAGFLAALEREGGLPFPVLIEDKGATATIHLRGTRAEADRDRLLEALQSRLDRHLDRSGAAAPPAGGETGSPPAVQGGSGRTPAPEGGPGLLRLQPGKASVEVRPVVEWDKARALRHLLQRWGASARGTFYAGDDVTDECVFAALAEGITVKVGEGPTWARYVAADPSEIYDFLREIVEAGQSGGAGRPARKGSESPREATSNGAG